MACAVTLCTDQVTADHAQSEVTIVVQAIDLRSQT